MTALHAATSSSPAPFEPCEVRSCWKGERIPSTTGQLRHVVVQPSRYEAELHAATLYVQGYNVHVRDSQNTLLCTGRTAAERYVPGTLAAVSK